MKFLRIFIRIILLITFFSNFIQAQNNTFTLTLTGAIFDKSTNAPLFYVNMGLLNAADSAVISVATTDKEGVFTFSNIKTGNYILKTSYMGYDVFERPLSVSGESNTIKLDTILLQPAAAKLEGITVATTKPVYMNDGEKILYNVSEDASIQTGTVADALQNAPGVEVDIEGNVTLRGVSSVDIWINDKPSHLKEENLKTYLQQLPANSLERIEVITNPSARYSAKRDGGIINIVTKTNIKRNSFISFGVNGSTRPMASQWLSYMFSNEKFSINLYFSGYYYFQKRKSNGYSTIFNENMDTASYRSYTNDYKWNSINTSAYLNVSYNIDSLKTITFYGGVWMNPFQNVSQSKDYKYREYINNPGIYDYLENATGKNFFWDVNFGLEYEHNFNDEGHTLLTEFYFDYWQGKDMSNFQRIYTNYPELNINKKMNGLFRGYDTYLNINYSLPYHEDGVIEIGFNGEYEHGFNDNRTDTLSFPSKLYLLDSMRYENRIDKEGSIEAYITVEHQFGNFKIKGGLRSQTRILNYLVINQPEHHGNKPYSGLFPSLHLSYKTICRFVCLF